MSGFCCPDELQWMSAHDVQPVIYHLGQVEDLLQTPLSKPTVYMA